MHYAKHMVHMTVGIDDVFESQAVAFESFNEIFLQRVGNQCVIPKDRAIARCGPDARGELLAGGLVAGHE